MRSEKTKAQRFLAKPLKVLVGRVGIEPTTNGLRVARTTNSQEAEQHVHTQRNHALTFACLASATKPGRTLDAECYLLAARFATLRPTAFFTALRLTAFFATLRPTAFFTALRFTAFLATRRLTAFFATL